MMVKIPSSLGHYFKDKAVTNRFNINIFIRFYVFSPLLSHNFKIKNVSEILKCILQLEDAAFKMYEFTLHCNSLKTFYLKWFKHVDKYK